MVKEYNTPVTIQVYLGSGKEAETIRENLRKRTTKRESMSFVVVELLRKADPTLFKGVSDGK